MGLFVLVLFNSFFFMDWRFSFFNLPYSFDTAAEANTETAGRGSACEALVRFATSILGEEQLVDEGSNLVWHQRIIQRVGVWRHLLSPMYISVVLFLSVLLLPAIFLPVTWYPWVDYVTNKDTDLSKNSSDKLSIPSSERFFCLQQTTIRSPSIYQRLQHC